MAKLKERVAEMAAAAGLAERGGFEPKSDDWLRLSELLDAGDMEGARRWAADFDVPLSMLPVLARVKQEVARLTPIAPEKEALGRELELLKEQDAMLARIQPATVAEVEAAAAKRGELRKCLAKLHGRYHDATQADREMRQLVLGFSELFDGTPGRPMRTGCSAAIRNAILAAGFDPGQLYWSPWREVCRRQPEKRRPRYVLRTP